MFCVILFALFFKNVFCDTKPVECGYKQCPLTRDGALNVHLIPHSHMDAGWVKTFEQYYFGVKPKKSTANVQLIYHSVVTELLHDKRRKFTFSESAFFWRWWKEQRPHTRATFRNLVAEGRVEFAGGGWVQNDEATPDYLHIIDQYTWGLRKLNDTLGPCGKPKAAWQIDSYGHSREQVSLLAQMGYDGLFIGRVDSKARQAMVDDYRMEFMWRGSDILGKMSDIMTHTLYTLYNAPNGFCFDHLCYDDPIVDDPDDRVYNADKRVNEFIAHIEHQAKYYDHDNILVTMGGDFAYQNAANWFMNMDKLINHVNSHPANLSDINIFYSTPSCYLKAIYLYGRRDKAIFTEKSDHLPYGSDTKTYWTGYYTSRPNLKYLARRAHVFLQVLKQLTVLARTGDTYELHLLRHAVALVLHHDAITGTSQQHVVNDFIKLLSQAIEVSTKKISNLLSSLTPTWGGSRRSKTSQLFATCHQLNMSQCKFMESQDSMILLIYNALSVKTYHHVRLPAIALHYSIKDANDEEVEYQLVPLPSAVSSLPGRSSSATQELWFEAENVPAIGFNAYYIATLRDQLEENAYAKKLYSHAEEAELVPFISNEYIKVTVNKQTGLLESMIHVEGVKVAISQNFYYYKQTQEKPQAGAYTFRPENNRPTPVAEKVTYHTVKGPLVKEIRQRFSDWITQIIRLHRGEEFVEFEWIVGPVPIGPDLGKDVVTIYSTNISNNGQFFTDSNSRMMMRRSCVNQTHSHERKPVPACYCPVTSRICIHAENGSIEMCVLADRTQGGTSYREGEVELMLHRRLLTDDDFGLEENLNEEAYGKGVVIRGRHRVVFGNYKQEMEGLTFSERVGQTTRRFNMEPWLFFTTGERINRRKWQNVRSKRYTALRVHGLPRHIQVLTLEPWKSGSVLLRLENTLETNSYRGQSKSDLPEEGPRSPIISVDLRKIFLTLQVKAVRETTLGANQWLTDARQMDWSTRYVYAGGDDGMLPEDNIDYRDDKTTSKGSAQDSEEDTEVRRVTYKLTPKPNANRRNKKGKKTQNKSYTRNKRSFNATEHFIDTTLNYNKTKEFDVIRDKRIINSENFENATRMETAIFNNKLKYQNVDRKLRFLTSKKGFPDDLSKNPDEYENSEEDFSYVLKRRASFRNRKQNAKNSGRATEVHPEEADDGVTKSIYEMYYKTPIFNPYSRGQEETRAQQRNEKKNKKLYQDSEEESEETTTKRLTKQKQRKSEKRNKGRAKEIDSEEEVISVPYKSGKTRDYHDSIKGIITDESSAKSELAQLRAKRRRESHLNEDDYAEPEVYDLEDEKDERPYGRRKKRTIVKPKKAAHPVSEPEQHDQEYTVMLRPTQIRTFVVWFETKIV